MDHQERIRLMIQSKLTEIASQLEHQIQILSEYGLVTDLDKQKMLMDARYSANAILKAIGRTEYPPKMQEELANRLLEQFEHSITRTIHKAASRAFSRNFLNKQLSQIEINTITKLGDKYMRWYQQNPKVIANLRRKTASDLRHLYRKGAISLLDLSLFFANYEKMILNIAQTYQWQPSLDTTASTAPPQEKSAPRSNRNS